MVYCLFFIHFFFAHKTTATPNLLWSQENIIIFNIFSYNTLHMRMYNKYIAQIQIHIVCHRNHGKG